MAVLWIAPLVAVAVTESAVYTPTESIAGDDFGRALAFSYPHLMAGAHNRESAEGEGKAYIIDVQTGAVAPLEPSDLDEDDEFGFAVAIVDTLALASSPNNDDGSSFTVVNSGSVHAFLRVSDTEWRELDKLTADDEDTDDEFGYSVALQCV